MTSQRISAQIAAGLALFALFFCTSAAAGANRLRIDDATVEIGQTGRSVAVLLDCDEAISSVAIAVDYDPGDLRVTGIAPGAAAAGAAYFDGTFGGGRIYFAVVADYDMINTVPPGVNHHVMTISFDVLAGTETTSSFAFRDDAAAREHTRLGDAIADPVSEFTATNGTVSIVAPGTGPEEVNAPSCLLATAASSSTISLSWTDNSSNESSFDIERRPAGSGSFARIGTSPANVTSYVDASVSGAASFQYRVRAVGSESSSDYTPVVTESTKRLGVVKAKGKLGKKGWKIALGRLSFDSGPAPYEGDGGEIRVRLGGLEFFASRLAEKVKRDKRSGAVVKVTLKDASKNKVTIDFKKKLVKAKLKIADPSAIDLASGTVPFEIVFSRFVAEIDLPVEIQGPKENKAVFQPIAGGAFVAVPELNLCQN